MILCAGFMCCNLVQNEGDYCQSCHDDMLAEHQAEKEERRKEFAFFAELDGVEL